MQPASFAQSLHEAGAPPLLSPVAPHQGLANNNLAASGFEALHPEISRLVHLVN